MGLVGSRFCQPSGRSAMGRSEWRHLSRKDENPALRNLSGGGQAAADERLAAWGRHRDRGPEPPAGRAQAGPCPLRRPPHGPGTTPAVSGDGGSGAPSRRRHRERGEPLAVRGLVPRLRDRHPPARAPRGPDRGASRVRARPAARRRRVPGAPDQRGTFDRDRELTSVTHLLRDHEEGVLTSRRDHYVDWARHVAHVEPDELDRYVDDQMSDAYSIHFHCWQPDAFLDFFVAAREKVGLDFQMVAFAPPETHDDLEFIVILAKGRFDGIRLPGKPPSRLRELLLNSGVGPPLGALWRAVKRAGK